MVRFCVVVFLGSLWCSWVAGSASVAARVERAVSNLAFDRDLSRVFRFTCVA